MWRVGGGMGRKPDALGGVAVKVAKAKVTAGSDHRIICPLGLTNFRHQLHPWHSDVQSAPAS